MNAEQHAKVLEALEIAHNVALNDSLELRVRQCGYMNQRQKAADAVTEVMSEALSIMRAVQVGVPEDLRDRCAEIIEWQDTGILKGEKLREFAAKQRWADDPHVLMIAERETAREAFKLLAVAPPTEHEVKP